jgi:hypothetical protein
MTHPRRWAAALLIGAVAIGTLSDRPPERTVPRTGDYWIVAGDFHVHGGPGDGTLLPWELRREARWAGLDVIAITNHNTTYAARFAEWWDRRYPGEPIMIAGEEITSPDYHMAAIGIHTTVSRRQSAASAIDAVHSQGGVAIAAHPGPKYWPGYDEAAVQRLDGAERVNDTDPVVVAQYGEFWQRVVARNPDVAAIGSSDFHGWPVMGRARTYLFVRERSRAGVLEAIREGRTVAVDDRGNLYGADAWVRQIGSNRPAGRSAERTGIRRVSVACAWLGLLGLVLLRR